jgi:hypothetical protein
MFPVLDTNLWSILMPFAVCGRLRRYVLIFIIPGPSEGLKICPLVEIGLLIDLPKSGGAMGPQGRHPCSPKVPDKRVGRKKFWN